MDNAPDGQPPPRGNPSTTSTTQLMILGILMEGGLGLVGLCGTWLFHIRLHRNVDWSWHGLLLGILGTIPLLLVLPIVELAPGRAFARLRLLYDELLAPLFRPVRLRDLFLISLAAGLGEEIFFRGFLQSGLERVIPNWGNVLGLMELNTFLAIASSAILFGLCHPISGLYVTVTALMGFYLGVLFSVTGNLLVPIVAHGFYDFLALLYLARWRRPRGAIPPS